MMNHLFKHGAHVVDSSIARIHVSGHGRQGDLQIMYDAVRPKFLIPIHGETRQLYRHAEAARKWGHRRDQIVLAESGDVIELDEERARVAERVTVGRTLIDERDVVIVQGTAPGLLPVNLYFDDKSGLLVRVVRWNQTLVGPVPSEINYGDYRTVAGIQMPFTWTATQTYMQMTITLREVSVNVPLDVSRFAKPREFRAANR